MLHCGFLLPSDRLIHLVDRLEHTSSLDRTSVVSQCSARFAIR